MLYKLISKNQLTPDVFELTFEWKDVTILPGHFFMFNLKSGLKRAYSILGKNWNQYQFIIKKLEGWRGWSKEICDYPIGEEVDFSWPFGHFLLKNTDCAKIFIGTGTGFVPLYSQINETLRNNNKNYVKYIFGIRTFADTFYLDKLDEIKKNYPNFDYEIYLSREEKEWFQKWYVLDYLTPENLKDFEEAYLCWSPAMVWDAKILLEKWGLKKENIYSEQY